MKTIAIVTDSNGLPNPECAIYNTWVHQCIKELQNEDNIIYTYLIRSLTSDDIIYFRNLSKDLFSGSFDLVILSFGIVDCSRRILPRWLLYSLGDKFLIKNIVNYCNRKLLPITSKYIPYKWVTIAKFKKNLLTMKTIAHKHDTKICFLPIPPSTCILRKKIQKIDDEISLYNNEFKICDADLISIKWPIEIDQYFSKDGYHLNQLGHSLIKREVLKYVFQKV